MVHHWYMEGKQIQETCE